jgi:hypothetical protein
VPKVHNKLIKKTEKGFNYREQKSAEVCPGLAHRTTRCTRDSNSKLLTFGNSGSHSAIIHRTVRCSTGLSSVPAEQWLLRANGRLQKALNALQCAPESEQSQMAHRTLNSACPVAQKTEAPTVRIQRPGDVAGAPDSVRCAMRQQPSPNG